MIKYKGYFSKNNGITYYRDGEKLYDKGGVLQSKEPTDLVRFPREDLQTKYETLWMDKKISIASGTFKQLKDKTIVKIYCSSGGSYFGIVKDGGILEQTGYITDARCRVYEEVEASKEQREMLETLYEIDTKKKEILDEIDRLNNKVRTLNRSKSFLSKEISKSFGFLPQKNFVEIFERNLPESFKEDMKNKGYEIRKSDAIYYDSFEVLRKVIIEENHNSCMVKWFDGEIFLNICEPEQKKIANKYIEQFSKPLITNSESRRWLEIDNDLNLILYESYQLSFENPTKEEAERLAKEFSCVSL